MSVRSHSMGPFSWRSDLVAGNMSIIGCDWPYNRVTDLLLARRNTVEKQGIGGPFPTKSTVYTIIKLK